jgi:hypothetical protein
MVAIVIVKVVAADDEPAQIRMKKVVATSAAVAIGTSNAPKPATARPGPPLRTATIAAMRFGQPDDVEGSVMIASLSIRDGRRS